MKSVLTLELYSYAEGAQFPMGTLHIYNDGRFRVLDTDGKRTHYGDLGAMFESALSLANEFMGEDR